MDKNIMDLKKYREEVSRFLAKVDTEFITNCEKNEIYIIDHWFREYAGKQYTRSSSFLDKTREKIDEIIRCAKEDVPWELRDIFEDIEEDIADYMWWTVEKYTITDDDTMKFAQVDYDIDGNIIDAWFAHNLPKQYEKLRDEWERLTFKRNGELGLDLDFQPGDILQINDLPYGKSKYAVYADKEQINDTIRHNFIIIDEYGDVDIIDSLEMSYELASYSFPFAKMQKATTCHIASLNNIKTIVESHPDVYKGIRFLWRAETNIVKKKWILNRILQNTKG